MCHGCARWLGWGIGWRRCGRPRTAGVCPTMAQRRGQSPSHDGLSLTSRTRHGGSCVLSIHRMHNCVLHGASACRARVGQRTQYLVQCPIASVALYSSGWSNKLYYIILYRLCCRTVGVGPPPLISFSSSSHIHININMTYTAYIYVLWSAFVHIRYPAMYVIRRPSRGVSPGSATSACGRVV